MNVRLRVDGRDVTIPTDGGSLLDALRDHVGATSVKDGCSPQGQCGCCTVLVDGAPRVSCVTPLKRVAGRAVTTADGLDPAMVEPLVARMSDAGGSQCGFCTPGILVRLAALGPEPARPAVEQALLAHLCRCTGWQTILEAAAGGATTAADDPARDLEAASRRATIEGGTHQAVGPDVVRGRAPFAADTVPAGTLIAVPDGTGGWAVGNTMGEARAAVAKVQGRRSGTRIAHPLDLPPGDWAVTLQTTWVEPAYLEPDASWCEPGGVPASPAANGGAFGAKQESVVTAAARRLADEHGRPVLAVLPREDTVRLGPKRPPIAAGLRADGTGVLRVATTDGIAETIRAAAPGLEVEEVDVVGPPTSAVVRAAGWAEAAVLSAAAESIGQGRDDRGGGGPATVTVTSPEGARATATVGVDADGRPTHVAVRVACGDPLDRVVLRSYVIGAAHMALGWVCSEGIALDAAGVPVDLTIRSFGVLRARDTPPIDVDIEAEPGKVPVNGSDAAFAAVAAATWIAQGRPPAWPTHRGVSN